MANQSGDTTDDCGLDRFERNRYFTGKLLTARDMRADQQYHRERLEAVTRHVTGHGIVCGLETTVSEDEGEIRVEVAPGLAFDCCGRPIVVEHGAEESFDPNRATGVPGVSVYLDFWDCLRESVPLPGAEDGCEEECTYSRVLEACQVDLEPGSPETADGGLPGAKATGELRFPDPGDFDVEAGEAPPPDSEALLTAAKTYAENADHQLEPCEECGDERVFLGYFEPDEATGSWSRVAPDEERGDSRPHVYDNDMLYSAIARHAADFSNPHETSLDLDEAQVEASEPESEPEPAAGRESDTELRSGYDAPYGTSLRTALSSRATSEREQTPLRRVGPGPWPTIGVEDYYREDEVTFTADNTVDLETDLEDREINVGVSEAFVDELRGAFQRLEERVGRLEGQLSLHGRYVRDKTLKYGIDSFAQVSRRFDVGTASDIVSRTKTAVDRGAHESRRDFVEFVRDVAATERSLVDELSGRATKATLANYRNAVSRLENRLQSLAPKLDDSSERLTGEETLGVAIAQDRVCETARWLQDAPELVVGPGGYAISPAVLETVAEGQETVPDATGMTRDQAASVLEGTDLSVNYQTSGDVTADEMEAAQVVSETVETTAEGQRVLNLVLEAATPLTDVVHVGPARAGDLREAGIQTAEQLADATVEEVVDATNLNETQAREAIDDAAEMTGSGDEN